MTTSTTTPQRDEKGRFLPGNTVSKLGWQGLVNKHFGGNADLAKQWLRLCGDYGYGRCFFHPKHGYPSWVKKRFRTPPPSPSDYSVNPSRLEFTLADVGELAF